jgi:hypothetical protein
MNLDRNAVRMQMQNARRGAEPQYDLADFARKHGIGAVKAQQILDRAGGSREAADLLAKRSKPALDSVDD